MPPEDKKKLDDALQAVADLSRALGDLTKIVEGRGVSEIVYAGPYVPGSPTADGTVSMLIGGLRFNVLVDKV